MRFFTHTLGLRPYPTTLWLLSLFTIVLAAGFGSWALGYTEVSYWFIATAIGLIVFANVHGHRRELKEHDDDR